MKIAELKQVDGKMKLVVREATKEEIAEIPEIEEQEAQTDALTEMITKMSTATTLAQMRNAAKAFLEKMNGV